MYLYQKTVSICILLLFTFLLVKTRAKAYTPSGVKITIIECNKTIDLTSHITHITYEINLLLEGQRNINSFRWISKEPGQLAYLNVEETTTNTNLKIKKMNVTGYVVQLKQPLKPQTTISLVVHEVRSYAGQPLLKKIGQSELNQFDSLISTMVYEGNMLIYSYYPVLWQSTTVLLLSSNEERWNTPSENSPPLSYEPLRLHYSIKTPPLVITDLRRKISVSHWGAISIEDRVDVKHAGSVWSDEFSRGKYSTNVPSVHSFTTFLPASARNFIQYDNIGKKFGAVLTYEENGVRVDFQTRYPLLGGWHTVYTLRYIVPLYEYVYEDKNTGLYFLNIRLLDHVLNDVPIEKAEIKVFLPMLGRIETLQLPYQEESTKKEFVPTFPAPGKRQVLTVKVNHLVEEHIQNFQISYSWYWYMYLYQPIIISCYIYLLFLCIIISRRFDFTICVEDKMVE